MISGVDLPRILIADSHLLLAEGCKRILEAEYDVVATIADGRSLVRTAAELSPDLIIVDVALPLLNGLDAVEQVKEFLPTVKVIFLSPMESVGLAAEAVSRGASGYFLKTCAAAELLVAVREVLRGGTYLSPTISRDAVARLFRRKKRLAAESEMLTVRQREVLQLLAEGRSMKEVGSVLNLTTRTVQFHKYRLMEVLHVNNNAALVRYAVRRHLIAA